MAFYTPTGDGLFEVQTDDGRTLRTAMDPEQLAAMGIQEKPREVKSFDSRNTVAQNMPELVTGIRPSWAVGNPGVMDANAALEDSVITPQREAARRAESAPEPPPPAHMSVQRAPQPQAAQPSKLDAMQGLVESQLVRRSSPRKGGMMPSAKQVTVGPTPSEEDIATLETQERAADDVQLAHREQLAQQRNEALDQRLGQVYQQEMQIMEAGDRRQKIDAELQRLQQFSEQQERAANEIKDLTPSDEFFKNNGGGWGRVLAGLVVMLGGIGQGMSAAGGVNTPNAGLESIKRGIDETAQKLKDEHERRQAAGQRADNAYSRALAVYGTPEMAMESLRMQGEAIADRKLGIMLEQYKTAEELAAYQVQKAEREAQRAERRANLNAQRLGTVQQSYRFDPGSSGGAALDPRMFALWADLQKMRGEPGKTNALMVRLPSGEFVQAPSEQAAEDARKQIAASVGVVDGATRIAHLYQQPGAKTDRDRLGQISTAIAQLQLQLKESGAIGSLDEGAQAKLNEITGDPTKLFQYQDVVAKLSEVAEGERAKLENLKRYRLNVGATAPAGVKSDE